MWPTTLIPSTIERGATAISTESVRSNLKQLTSRIVDVSTESWELHLSYADTASAFVN